MAGEAFQLKLFGNRELKDALATLDRKVQRKVLRNAIRRNIRTAFTAIKRLIPVGMDTEGRRHLRDLMKITVRMRRGKITGGLVFPTREELGIADNDPYYWPMAVEYGHRAPYGSGARTPEHPFVRPGWDSVEQSVAARLSSDILDGVRKEWAKE